MRKKTRREFNISPFLILIIFFVFFLYSFIFVDRQVRPVVEVLSEIEARIMGTQSINEGVTNAILKENVKYDDLVNITKDEQGNISLIQANTMGMNLFASDITALVQNSLEAFGKKPVKIPLGTVLGSQIFANYGPKFNIEIIPAGAVMVDFFSEFKQAGINQTIHRIYVKVDTKVQVIIPFSNKFVEIGSEVPIAETIIVGDVPDTYIYVPDFENKDFLEFYK